MPGRPFLSPVLLWTPFREQSGSLTAVTPFSLESKTRPVFRCRWTHVLRPRTLPALCRQSPLRLSPNGSSSPQTTVFGQYALGLHRYCSSSWSFSTCSCRGPLLLYSCHCYRFHVYYALGCFTTNGGSCIMSASLGLRQRCCQCVKSKCHTLAWLCRNPNECLQFLRRATALVLVTHLCFSATLRRTPSFST